MHGSVTLADLSARFGQGGFVAAALIAAKHPDWSLDQVAGQLAAEVEVDNQALKQRISALEAAIAQRDRELEALRSSGWQAPLDLGAGAGHGIGLGDQSPPYFGVDPVIDPATGLEVAPDE